MANKTDYTLSPLDLTQTVKITSGTAVSAVMDCLGLSLQALVTPNVWTAAGIAFQASLDGSNWFPLYNNSGEVTIASANIPTSAGRYFALNENDFLGVRYLKVVSGTNAANVNQAQDSVISLVLRRNAG